MHGQVGGGTAHDTPTPTHGIYMPYCPSVPCAVHWRHERAGNIIDDISQANMMRSARHAHIASLIIRRLCTMLD